MTEENKMVEIARTIDRYTKAVSALSSEGSFADKKNLYNINHRSYKVFKNTRNTTDDWKAVLMDYLDLYDKEKQDEAERYLGISKKRKPLTIEMLSVLTLIPRNILKSFDSYDEESWRKRIVDILVTQHPLVLFFQFYYLYSKQNNPNYWDFKEYKKYDDTTK